MAGAFLCPQDLCSSRDGAETAIVAVLTIGNVRINPKTLGGRHLRVSTLLVIFKTP